VNDGPPRNEEIALYMNHPPQAADPGGMVSRGGDGLPKPVGTNQFISNQSDTEALLFPKKRSLKRVVSNVIVLAS